MKNISTYFKLGVKQSDLEFVDVKLDDDNLLFIDPRLIERRPDRLTRPMADCLAQYFGFLILFVSSGKHDKANYHLSGIQEPKETRLGYGQNNSNGRSAGKTIKNELLEAIKNNRVIKEKKIDSFSDLSFFVSNMGCDRISDITTKIIKVFLIQFTQQQCRKYNIAMKPVKQKDIYNPKNSQWENSTVDLPVYADKVYDKPIIFVPKNIVNTEVSMNSSLGTFFRFARNFIIEKNDKYFLKGIPRNGKDNSILAKDFDETVESMKEELAKWVVKYPEILEGYLDYSIERVKPLSNSEITNIVYH